MAFVIKPIGLHYVKIFTRFAECKQTSSDVTQPRGNMKIPFLFKLKATEHFKVNEENVREEENDFGLMNTASVRPSPNVKPMDVKLM